MFTQISVYFNSFLIKAILRKVQINIRKSKLNESNVPRHTFRSNYLVFIEGNGLILKMILFHGNMVRSIMDYLA
mgnify:CR=1 FL=1